MNKFEKWNEELSLFDDMERIEFMVDLAKKETSLPKELRIPSNLVTGCMSQIWVSAGVTDGIVTVYYDSDALITKGITHIVCDCFSGHTLSEAKAISKADFENLGIKEVLTSQRRNGLSSLINTIIKKVHELE